MLGILLFLLVNERKVLGEVLDALDVAFLQRLVMPEHIIGDEIADGVAAMGAAVQRVDAGQQMAVAQPVRHLIGPHASLIIGGA